MVTGDTLGSLVVFALGEHRFALSMSVVERIVRVVEITPILDAPPGVVGVVNVHGRIVPVFDIRPRFGLPAKEVDVDDHLVIAHTGNREVAILVDSAVDVVSAGHAASMLALDNLSGLGGTGGLMAHGGEIVPVQDLSRFLPAMPARTAELKLVA
jgi:purine-binding chemotaxis protein CheW